MEGSFGFGQQSLWIGDIDVTMTENMIRAAFPPNAGVVGVKFIRDKNTGYPVGYGFIEFSSPAAAQQALRLYNGSPIPGTSRALNLNAAEHGESEGTMHGIYISGLPADATDAKLYMLFAQRYSTVRTAKVIVDPTTGLPRGYGFVKFVGTEDCNRAIAECQGIQMSGKPLRVSPILGSLSAQQQQHQTSLLSSSEPTQQQQYTDATDPNNTTIYVGNLHKGATEEEVLRVFSPCGTVASVRILPGKCCCFVNFATKASAEAAFSLNGLAIGPQRVKLSWGKVPARSVAAVNAAAAAAASSSSSTAHQPLIQHQTTPATSAAAAAGVDPMSVYQAQLNAYQQYYYMYYMQAAAAAAAANATTTTTTATTNSTGSNGGNESVDGMQRTENNAEKKDVHVSHADKVVHRIDVDAENDKLIENGAFTDICPPQLSRPLFGVPYNTP